MNLSRATLPSDSTGSPRWRDSACPLHRPTALAAPCDLTSPPVFSHASRAQRLPPSRSISSIVTTTPRANPVRPIPIASHPAHSDAVQFNAFFPVWRSHVPARLEASALRHPREEPSSLCRTRHNAQRRRRFDAVPSPPRAIMVAWSNSSRSRDSQRRPDWLVNMQQPPSRCQTLPADTHWNVAPHRVGAVPARARTRREAALLGGIHVAAQRPDHQRRPIARLHHVRVERHRVLERRPLLIGQLDREAALARRGGCGRHRRRRTPGQLLACVANLI